MTKHQDLPENGLFVAPYVAFLETVTHLRPQLHRYCARMVGSSTEGEDVMQEALFDAYHKLDTLEEGRATHFAAAGSAPGRRPRLRHRIGSTQPSPPARCSDPLWSGW